MRLLSLSDFEGAWHLVRTIRDLRGGPDGRFEGHAILGPSGNGLSYMEEGSLLLEGQAAVTASRRYFWRVDDAGRIAVDFADGRPFHSFSLGEVAEAEHWCDPDSYRVTYRLCGWPNWQTEWRVQGPRKDYRLLSRYRRAS
jgi:hypothetical protein